jgi:NADP-dependent 3-hydroxy acid dehydrogenase YdfG
VAIALDGAVACVTGGARGIGRATSAELAARGATVWIGDLDLDEAERAAGEIEGAVRAAELDVTERASFADLVYRAEREDGPLDLLVNNAGIMPLGPFLQADQETTARTIAINLEGVINGMQLALPGMVERRRGHVANVASMMAKLPVPGAAVYTATKHAVLGLTDTVRYEIDSSGVTLSTILPTIVRTELISGVSLPRIAPAVEPDEVARAIADSAHNGRHEVHVPRWLGAYDVVEAALPSPLMGVARRLLGDRRALEGIDAEQRAAYEHRARRD